MGTGGDVNSGLKEPFKFKSGRPFYYVSDLHLNHMLKSRFPKEATERQIADFLSNIAVKMVETVPFSSYMSAIGTIAEEVRAFGGEGKAHGCIVDIDFINHVYLDPLTGRLKFYFATSINDRIEYEHLDALLRRHAPQLLVSYETLLREKNRRTDTTSEARRRRWRGRSDR